MRMRIVGLALIVAAGLQAPACAQSDVLFSKETRAPLTTPAERADLRKALAESDSFPANPWSIDFLIGVPTGVRVKRMLDRNSVSGWMVEGFLGYDYGLPVVGAGLRYAIVPWSNWHNVFAISPGWDVYAVDFLQPTRGNFFANGSFAMVGFDLDISWRHAYSETVTGDFGLKVGVATDFIFPLPIPILSVFAGLRF